jgi:hypothetical protein
VTPPIVETFYRVDGVVTRAWRYAKLFAFGALLGYAFLAHRKLARYERIAAEADGALAAAHAHELHDDSALARACSAWIPARASPSTTSNAGTPTRSGGTTR